MSRQHTSTNVLHISNKCLTREVLNPNSFVILLPTPTWGLPNCIMCFWQNVPPSILPDTAVPVILAQVHLSGQNTDSTALVFLKLVWGSLTCPPTASLRLQSPLSHGYPRASHLFLQSFLLTQPTSPDLIPGKFVRCAAYHDKAPS